MSLEEFSGVHTYIQQVEDVLYSKIFKDPASGYRKYLNVDSFISWYMVNEITKNQDARLWSSIYTYYNPETGLLYRGPVWDFDIALGNIDYSNCDDPEGFWIKTGPWYDRLFKDPWFIQELQQAWKQHLPFLQELPADIRQRAGELSAAQKHNFLVWDILDNYVWPNAVVTGSYQGEIDYLTEWLQRRIDWLDTAIRDL